MLSGEGPQALYCVGIPDSVLSGLSQAVLVHKQDLFQRKQCSHSMVNKHGLVLVEMLLLISMNNTANSRQLTSYSFPQNTHDQTHVVLGFDAMFTSKENVCVNLLCFIQHEQFFQERQEMYPSRSPET